MRNKVTYRLVDLDTPTGPMRTHVWEPAGHDCTARRWAGLLLYSEIFQITEPIAWPTSAASS